MTLLTSRCDVYWRHACKHVWLHVWRCHVTNKKMFQVSKTWRCHVMEPPIRVTIQNWTGKNFSKKVLKKLCCKTKVFWWNTEFSALPYQPLWHHRILAWIKTSILPLMKIDAKWAFQKRSAFLFSNWNMQQIESWKKENITFSNWCRPKALDRT